LTSDCDACIAAAATSAVGMIDRQLGSAEHGHHRIADVLHHRSAGGQDRPVHLGTVTIQLLSQQRRICVLADRPVSTDIAHQYGHVELLAVAWMCAAARMRSATPVGNNRAARPVLLAFVALWILFSRSSEPAVPPTPRRRPDEGPSAQASTDAGDGQVAAAIALIGPPRQPSRATSSSASSPPVRRTGLINALTTAGSASNHRATSQ
jgi:hypothetical protein